MSNYIGIDISLNSTAVYIERPDNRVILSFTNKKDTNIWINELKSVGVKFTNIYRKTADDYSKAEVLKLKDYWEISDTICKTIVENLDPDLETFCNVEGYSFSRNTSSILDIVSLSTLIKTKLLVMLPNLHMNIISPLSLKLESCKLVYPPLEIGVKKKKLKWVNREGIAGGSFKKPQMFKAFIEGRIDAPIYNFLFHHQELLDREKIPNPIEDIIDSVFCLKVMKKWIETGSGPIFDNKLEK
jgi:hypothetical protein